jgi:trigger factor
MQGLDLNTYLQYMGMTLDQMRAQLRPQAAQQVRLRLALEAIARKEALTVDAAAIEAEYERISSAYNVPVEQVKSLIDEADIVADMKVKAAMDFVKAKAITKAPAKKPAEATEE